jgi:hypothetical protein
MTMLENTIKALPVASNGNENEKKTWVTPVVSESPVNDLTASGSTGTGGDANNYS